MRCVFAQKVFSSRNLKKFLHDNGYPESIIDRGICNKLARFRSLPKFGPNKCPVLLLNLKTKLNLLLSIVSEQLNHESFSQPEKSFHLSSKMLCLPFNKVWSYTNMCAAVIAGTWATHLYIWRKESSNMILSKESNNQ